MSRLVLLTFVAALATFCVVQDRVTAAGARRYVDSQRAALAAGGPTVTIDEVMRPAVRASVQQGLLWGSVAAAVVGLGGVWSRRTRRE